MAYCEARMYADDTHLTYAGDCVDNLHLYLSQLLDNVHNWLRANKLTLNKVTSGIGAIKRIRHLVPQPTLHLI